MKLIQTLASTLFLGLSATALASPVAQVTCNDGNGFRAVLKIQYGTSIGTLTYGQGEELTTVENLDTSFNGAWGAATKGTEILLTVTPSGEQLIGQLIIRGKTRYLLCEE